MIAILAFILLPMLQSPWVDRPAVAVESTPGSVSQIERFVQRVVQSLGQPVDWDQHYPYLAAAIQECFQRNGWDSEPDLFSLDLICQVAAIPPWRLQERFDLLTARLSERYLLDSEQEAVLRGLLARELQDLFIRHAPRLLPSVLEAARTRLAGEPFTVEQVARWSAQAGPALEDVRRQVDQAAAELMNLLDPDQQDLLRVDLDRYHHRLDRMSALRARWERGEWDPADWGLTYDPIQQGGGWVSDGVAPPPANLGPQAVMATSPPDEPPAEIDPWARYVQNFIRRYRLDQAQQRRAWAIYHSACRRRDLHERQYHRQVERYQRPIQEPEQSGRRLEELAASRTRTRELIFDAMKKRLECLPTRAQRQEAAPAAAEPGVAQ